MDASLIATWAIFAIVVVAYAVFAVWRVRVRRRKNAPAVTKDAADDDARLARALEAAARIAGTPPIPPPEAPITVATPAALPTPELDLREPVGSPTGPHVETTVIELLQGIQLPNDLAPLTTMAPRDGAADRVAFWTDTTVAEVVGPAFVEALRQIGCEVTQLDVGHFAINRAGARGVAAMYPDGRLAVIDGKPGYPSVPTAAFVVEVYLPLR